MITLAVPELDVAYFSELANVMAAADRRGCTVLIHATGSRRDRELSALNGFDAQFTDGVILSALTLRQRDLDNHEKHLPVVLLGRRHTPGSLDHVGIDNIAAAREATAHLLARGRRRIAVVGGSLRGRQGTDRLRTIGYAEALKAAGLPFDSDLVAPRDAEHLRTDRLHRLHRSFADRPPLPRDGRPRRVSGDQGRRRRRSVLGHWTTPAGAGDGIRTRVALLTGEVAVACAPGRRHRNVRDPADARR